MTEVGNLDEVVTRQQVTRRSGTARGDLLVVLTTAAAALMTWTFWTQVAGIELAADTAGGSRPVVAVDVVLVALLAAVAGVLLLRALQSRSPRGLHRWTVVASIVCALSLLGALAGATPTAVGALMSLHVVVGAAVVLGARRVRAGTA